MNKQVRSPSVTPDRAHVSVYSGWWLLPSAALGAVFWAALIWAAIRWLQ